MRLHIINGPNLNLIGQREPQIYGSRSLEDYLSALVADYSDQAAIEVFQSNHEGQLLDQLQAIGRGESSAAGDPQAQGVILNAGALGHTSLALGDCLRSIDVAVVEVHISNVYAREAFRQNSFVTPAVRGSISGLGLEGYRLAVEWHLAQTANT